MKNNNFILPLLVFLCLLCSCEKTLMENPQSDLSPDAFFNTEDQCIQATNGVYSHLPGIFNQGALWSATMAGTDLVMYHGGTATISAIQDYNFSAPTEANSYAVWKSCYAAIRDANFVIDRVTSAPIDDEIKNRLIGESKYIRAMCYFIVSNVFGDVPLWTKELDFEEVSKLARSPLAEVRIQMITDLTDASVSLPESYDAIDLGRVTKGSALSLLAKVYLFNKEWENAYQAASEVMNAGNYTLMSNYSDLFNPYNEHKNNSESIFEIQYKRDAATNQNFVVNSFYSYFFPLGDSKGGTYSGIDFETTLLQSYAAFYPSQRLVDLFEPADKRRDVMLSWGFNDQTFLKYPIPGRPWFGPKFWDLTANRTSSDKNLYFLRYADVIMMAAEAANELGETGQAILLMNEIEERAGLPALNNTMNQNQLRSFIMDERGREFTGEFQRKWDLARWAKLEEAINSISDENPKGAQNVQSYHAIFPIPYDEIVKNGNLTQNPGY